ncbi:hypothetical protein Tco_0850618, partial [Tanacetum coccineum]
SLHDTNLMTSRKRRTMFPKVVIQMDTDTDENSDDDDDEDLDVKKKLDEFDDEIVCESKIEDFKGKKYNIEGNTNWIVELDSSTKDKFSRHLIIRLPGIAFKDNRHVGAFVKHICLRIHYARGRDKKFKQLFISKDSSPADSGYLFIDNVVYSKNRCFRLHLSSKAWKNSVLLPTGRFKCKEMSEEDVFMLSLICNVEAECEKLLTCNMDIGFINVLKYDTKRNHESYKRRTHNFSGKSPFPKIDQFMEFISTIGEVKGKIRSWYCFSDDLLFYNMLRNRFCEKIGREHKSNHVMYVVDLQRNVIDLPSVQFHHVMSETFIIGEQNGSHELIHKSLMDSYEEDEWWCEAMLVTEKVENKPIKLDKPNEYNEVCDEDDDWWMIAEATASEIELTYYGQT